MGDYWNDSGFYEQSRARHFDEMTARDQAMRGTWEEQGRGMEQLRGHEYVQNARSSGNGGYSGSTSSAIGFAIGRLFARPLVKIGTLPALLSYSIFLMIPLSIAAIYFFRSLPYWLVATLVFLLLASSSPLLVKIIRAVVVIALIIAALFVIIIVGFIFHWWHFMPINPVPLPIHSPSLKH